MRKYALTLLLLICSIVLGFAGGCGVPVHTSCSPSAGGKITSSSCTYTAVPNPGYTFSHWMVGGEAGTGSISAVKRTSNPYTIEDGLASIIAIYGGELTLTAYFKKVTTYTITWKNWDGEVLMTTTVNANAVPSYNGSTPTRPATEQYTYTFSGWTPDITAATEDKTYTATYTQTLRQYAISVQSASTSMGIVSGGGTYDYGTEAILTAIPNTCYEFTQWSDDNIDNPRTIIVTRDTTYTAEFIKLRYAIHFNNYDGTELKLDSLDCGSEVEYTGQTPIKPASVEYTYSFKGWEPAIVPVSGDATYTAQFDSIANSYRITWQDEDGNIIKIDEVEGGEIPVYVGETPTKAATAEYTYEFAGWLPKIKAATEDVRYTTFFERNKIETPTYAVNINGENCSLHISSEMPEGATLHVEAVADDCFRFEKWSDGNTDIPRTITITGDATYTAEFTKLKYTITTESDNPTRGSTSVTK